MTSRLGARLLARLPAWRARILLALLVLLYLLLLQPLQSGMAHAFFIGHLGLFILWQPLVEGHQRLSSLALTALTLGALLATFALNGWLLMLWIMMLAGIVGGKVLLSAAPRMRLFHLLALGFLVASLLLLATPLALPTASLPAILVSTARVGMPLLLLIMMFLPQSEPVDQATELVDFINSVFVFLLLAVLVLGSLALMLLTKIDYANALLQSLVVLGGVLLLLGWSWSPHAGFSGWGNIFSRYILSAALPAERWLHSLAELALEELEPEAFVAKACEAMRKELLWVNGISWVTIDKAGAYGNLIGTSTEFKHQEIGLTIFTRYPLPPSLIWHFNLLAQLLGEFHADKKRAKRLKELSYMQAVHETGARLTHDIKNILQTLQLLCHAAEEPGADDSTAYRALLRRQLPIISMRLATSLDKLRVRRDGADDVLVRSNEWWQESARRYEQSSWIDFRFVPGTSAAMLPATLFSSVLDNLLSNAATKRQREPGLEVSVILNATSTDGCNLTVSDDGSAVDPAIAGRLLQGPVRSEDGLGIGLYQAARQAQLLSYRLSLEERQQGKVCFRLAPSSA